MVGGRWGGGGAKCARGSAAAVSGEGPPSLPMCGAERYYSLGGPLETRPLRAPTKTPSVLNALATCTHAETRRAQRAGSTRRVARGCETAVERGLRRTDVVSAKNHGTLDPN